MSIFRNTVWFLKGMQEYTVGGFTTASKKFREDDLSVDCSDLSYMITGANSGIGRQTALEIAKRGGTVHLVCRNPEFGQEARDDIQSQSGNSKIHLHILDLSKPKEISSFLGKWCSEHEKLDVLVNNAGCMVNTREVTEDNLEKNFATNTLGTYIITTGLLDKLKKSDEPRVVTVSSGGMLLQKLCVDDFQFEKMQPFDGTMAYAQNKRQQVVMTERLSLSCPGVHYSVMHPGWADTPAVRNSMPDFHAKMKDRLRSVEQGADTILWLAVAKESLKQSSGLFWQDRVPVSTHLPLAWTRSSAGDEDKLMTSLQQMYTKFTAGE